MELHQKIGSVTADQPEASAMWYIARYNMPLLTKDGSIDYTRHYFYTQPPFENVWPLEHVIKSLNQLMDDAGSKLDLYVIEKSVGDWHNHVVAGPFLTHDHARVWVDRDNGLVEKPKEPIEWISVNQVKNAQSIPKFLLYVFQWTGSGHRVILTYPLASYLEIHPDPQSDQITPSRSYIAAVVDSCLAKMTEKMGKSAKIYFTTIVIRDNKFMVDGLFPTFSLAKEWAALLVFSPLMVDSQKDRSTALSTD